MGDPFNAECWWTFNDTSFQMFTADGIKDFKK